MDKRFTINKYESIDSDQSGRTVLVTDGGDTLLLSAEVASALCKHLMGVINVTVTLKRGSYTTA